MGARFQLNPEREKSAAGSVCVFSDGDTLNAHRIREHKGDLLSVSRKEGFQLTYCGKVTRLIRYYVYFLLGIHRPYLINRVWLYCNLVLVNCFFFVRITPYTFLFNIRFYFIVIKE